MYENTFNDDEREKVMNSEIWPPYLFAGVDPEGQDYVLNYMQGMYKEAQITYDKVVEEEGDDEEGKDEGDVKQNDEL